MLDSKVKVGGETAFFELKANSMSHPNILEVLPPFLERNLVSAMVDKRFRHSMINF